MATLVVLLHEALYRIVRSHDNLPERTQRAERVIRYYIGACRRAAALSPSHPKNTRTEIDQAMLDLEGRLHAWKRLDRETGLICDGILDLVLRERVENASDQRFEDAVPHSLVQGGAPVSWGKGA